MLVTHRSRASAALVLCSVERVMGVRGGWRADAPVQTDRQTAASQFGADLWQTAASSFHQLPPAALIIQTNTRDVFKGSTSYPCANWEENTRVGIQPKQRLTHICRLSFLLQWVKYKDVIKSTHSFVSLSWKSPSHADTPHPACSTPSQH